jgi:hypothetical protein
MKWSISWHETCLKNWERSQDEAEEELQRHTERIERRRCDIENYRAKIALAKKKGLNGFDSERFGKEIEKEGKA